MAHIQDKKIYFISGLPRAGSTLLANLLLQNPRFHASATSGIADVLFGIRNQWDNLIEFKAAPNDAAKVRVLQSILSAYYADIEKPVIFDKSRSWLSLLEVAETALSHEIKVLVPVRDITDVLSSFEKLWRKRSASGQMGQEQKYYFQFQTIEGRLETWMRNDEPVGLAYNRVRDAVIRGHRAKLHFVEFKQLTEQPQAAMQAIYDFLEEPQYIHDFEQVEQQTTENDLIHGVPGLHTIRQKVASVPVDWPVILGKAGEPYQNLEFWRKL